MCRAGVQRGGEQSKFCAVVHDMPVLVKFSPAGAESLSAVDIQTLCLLAAFGALIASTDRHHGNMSLLLYQ
jgi:hypothetical protein